MSVVGGGQKLVSVGSAVGASRRRRRLAALCVAAAVAVAMPVAAVSAHNQDCPLISLTSCQYDN